MTKKMIDHMTEVIRRELIAHGLPTAAWLLVKVMTRLGEVGAGFAEEGPEEVKVKRFEASPQLIYKDEDGCKYKTKVEISHGKPNRYMKAAHDQYGKNSRWLQCPYVDAGQANFSNALFAQAGANRQGFATWGTFRTDSQSLASDAYPSFQIYNYYGLASEGMICNEWARTGVSVPLLTILNDTSNTVFRDQYNVDLLTNINSRFSTHEFFNSQEYSDVNIKVYVCQAKEKSFAPIWENIAPFGSSTSANFKIPKASPRAKGSSTSSSSYVKTGGGVNWFDSESSVPITHTNNEGSMTGTTNAIVETSSILGLTPQQSQVFQEHWEVLDVLDNTIGPNDTWDIHLEQKYSKSHSVRSWYSRFNRLLLGVNGAYDNALKSTSKGDIVLLTVFSGMPASNYILDGTDSKNTFPVDAGPSRVRHKVRHGINVSWPESLQPLDSSDPDLLSPFLAGQGWRVIKQKTNFTDRETYKYEAGEINVMTRLTKKEDDPKSDVAT